MPTFCICLELKTVCIVISDDRELVSAVTDLDIEMLVVVSAEHHVNACLIENRYKLFVEPYLRVPAVREEKRRNMHYGNLYRSLLEDRILYCLLDPLELSLTETVEINSSRILRSAVRLILATVYDKECYRSLTENEIRLSCRCRADILKEMRLTTACLMITSCVNGRYA